MNRKTLGIIFLSGVLVCGLGTGVAFAQYSKLEYAGERIYGEEDLISETFGADIEESGTIYLDLYVSANGTAIEEDDSVPTDKIYFDVVYNPEKVSMKVDKRPVEKIVQAADEYETASVTWYDGEDYDSAENGYVYRLDMYWRNSDDDIKEFFEIKDSFLADLKKGKIGSYTSVVVESVTVRVNPANTDRIEWY